MSTHDALPQDGALLKLVKKKTHFSYLHFTTNNMGMYNVNWFTDGTPTFIQKCLVDDKNFEQIGEDNSTSQRKQSYRNPLNNGSHYRDTKHLYHGFEY